jgi:hypothetical protein
MVEKKSPQTVKNSLKHGKTPHAFKKKKHLSHQWINLPNHAWQVQDQKPVEDNSQFADGTGDRQ